MSSVPHCPFCLDNNLLVENILSENSDGFLIKAQGIEGSFLIVPKAHAESPNALPDTWWAGFKQLFARIPSENDHYNVSLNVGERAGQTVKHLHFWIIPRLPGKPSSGKGLAGLIRDADRQV
jgi:diadenosine tetraphosphate (Ap4A) HIT family hydrolase